MAKIIVNGLVSGGVYAVLAVGFSLVFGVARILNMAHTAFYMIAAFFIFVCTVMSGFPLLLSVALAIFLVSVVGILCHKLFFDRIKEHTIPVMLVSVGLAILFQELLVMGFGGTYRAIPPLVAGFVEIAGVRVPWQHLLALGTSIVILIGLWLLLSKSRLGKAIRAVANDREIANVMGIDVGWVCTITVGISAGLAAIAGAIVAPIVMVHPLMWMQPLVITLAAVVLGGLGSIRGSVIGAFILGFAETATVFLMPMGSFLKGAVALGIMIVVLLIRPDGLFGVIFEEERL